MLVTIPRNVKGLSWAEQQEQTTRSKERRKYESQINDITKDLEKMKLRVGQLLSENEKLPEKEMIDRHEFELDVEEQQRRINQV